MADKEWVPKPDVRFSGSKISDTPVTVPRTYRERV